MVKLVNKLASFKINRLAPESIMKLTLSVSEMKTVGVDFKIEGVVEIDDGCCDPKD